MRYAVIVFRTESELARGEGGTVYGWYEQLGTAVNTALNLRQQGAYWYAVVVKVI
jgi:hypothetical protein